MLLLDQHQQLHQVSQPQLLLRPNLLKFNNQIRHNSSLSLLVYLHQTSKEVLRLLLMLRTCNGSKCNLDHRFNKQTHPWLEVISTNLSKFYQTERKCLNNKESLQIYKETSRTSLDNMEHNLGKLEPNLQKELDLKEFKNKLEAWPTHLSLQDLDYLELLVKCKVQCKIIMERHQIQQDRDLNTRLLNNTLLNSKHLEWVKDSIVDHNNHLRQLCKMLNMLQHWKKDRINKISKIQL